MRKSESEYIPPISEQIADHEDPFIDALFESPLFQSRRSQSQSQTKKVIHPAGNMKGENMAQAKTKQKYSDAEKRMYWMGVGSTLSRTSEGRKKQITTMANGDSAQIDSYRRGRAQGQKRKQDYLTKQRQARKNAGASKSGKAKKR